MTYFKNLKIIQSIICWVILFSSLCGETQIITGKVISADSGQPIEFANIILESGAGGYSNETGEFAIESAEFPTKITISHIAYVDTSFIIQAARLGIIYLKPEVIHGKDVFVIASRAVEGITPVAFSNVTVDEIETRYTVEDVPMILAMEPGVYSYSESGNGTGYSYVQIRGFDQSRIAVMLDNVPLNDNESYQVYWVDHADILADAELIQIQRGVGNSLYGTSAFGGSINVQTAIASEKPEASFLIGVGSYHTDKIVLKLNSGQLLGDKLSVQSRYSQIKTKGYRGYHDSYQGSFSLGIEYRGRRMMNQLRALIGYENTYLAWDGISSVDINNRTLRRQGSRQYVDNFLQQIYSLNSYWTISEKMRLTNTAYYVHGNGYYRSVKSAGYSLEDESGRNDRIDFYNFLKSYNLDRFYPGYPWIDNDFLGLSFTRRKWIVNHYFGTIPTLTWLWKMARLDIGTEFRIYQGDHFGEINRFSNPFLIDEIGGDWYRYYQYTGSKLLATGFVHLMLEPINRVKLTVDFQQQNIYWKLDQDTIGYAPGYQMNADWHFLNPRYGVIVNLSDTWTIFMNYSEAQREPADNQIIEADDVWSEPKRAAAEAINDIELGSSINRYNWNASLNLYRIRYFNEQLKNIDIEQEGEYDYFQAGKTLHQGLEFEFGYQASKYLSLNMNSSVGQHIFSTGDFKGNTIPNIPCFLINSSLNFKPVKYLYVFLTSRYVGRQYIDDENFGTNSEYLLFDGGFKISSETFELSVKVNNIFDTLYSTFGYGYEWDGYWAYYWPGATRNVFVSMSVKL
ncbi:MAG: TonB-dependent receptor plug domain-containing protein [Candidatus Marinimicrobia bacterium]|nr:TonB-dependent receptor plug domain-containing protein [Candidatus Neomarinimicrobiota bacterium]